MKNSRKERNGQNVKCCKKDADGGPIIGVDNMVVTADLDKNCLWRTVDENLIEVDSRESWRIESKASK